MLVDVEPTPSLARGPIDRFVDCVEVMRPRPGETTRAVDHLPDGTTRLIFRWFGGGVGDVTVRGPSTHAHYKTAAVLPLAVRVVFKPGGAYPFFGVPIDTLVDVIVPIAELWGPSGVELTDELLLTAQAGGDVGGLVQRALISRMRTAPFEPPAAVTARAAIALLARGDQSTIEVAKQLGISARHLLRAFRATVGFAPKTYARIARFQRALARGRAMPGRWNEIAIATGYFDHAHLIADFRDLAHVSPAALASAVPRPRYICP